MKFEDKSNPYFGGGKMTMQEWVEKDIASMQKEMDKKNFEAQECYGVDEKKVYTLTLAGGGPAMWVEIEVVDGSITGGRYQYTWYTPMEEVELDEREAQTVADYYGLYIE